MQPIPKSPFHNTNKFARITLKALEDVMGRNGLNAVLNLAHLPGLIDCFPPENLERGFNFADFSALNLALEEMYGPRGGRGLALRAGRVSFADSLRHYGALAGVSDLAFRVLPLHLKMRIGLQAMARIYSTVSDQYTTVHELGDDFVYTIHRCPVCWGRSGSDKPVCYMSIGLLQEGLKWVSNGREFRIIETKCIAMGDSVCEFTISKNPTN